MMDKYKARSLQQAFGQLNEEMGESVQAIGKIMRFGPNSVNPEIAPALQEKNIDWLMRELNDVELAIAKFREFVRPDAVRQWQKAVDEQNR